MSKISVPIRVIKNSQIDTDSVTTLLINTHCIVCGTAFPVGRGGKLYCSSRCKQFGFNHRSEVNRALGVRERGINQKPISFFIDEYSEYNRTQRLVKRHKELEKKRRDWEAVKQEIKLCENEGISARNYAWDSYVKGKLTNDEEDELYGIECEFEDDVRELNLKELSIEQWSFLRSLQASLDNKTFFQFSSS